MKTKQLITGGVLLYICPIVAGQIITMPTYVDHQSEAIADSSLIEVGGPGPSLGHISAIESQESSP